GPNPPACRCSTSLLLRRGCDTDQHAHLFRSATAAHAANGSRVEVVATDRQPAVRRSGSLVMRDIDREPAGLAPEPRIHPGMAGDFALAVCMQIAAHVARGDADGAAACNENVRLVLANALAARECVRSGLVDCSRALLVVHGLADRVREIQQEALARPRFTELPAGERGDGLVD